MHESSVAASVHLCARNVIVEGVLEGPQPQLDLDGFSRGTAGVAGSGNLCGEPLSSSLQHLSSITYGSLGSTTYSSLGSTCARCLRNESGAAASVLPCCWNFGGAAVSARTTTWECSPAATPQPHGSISCCLICSFYRSCSNSSSSFPLHIT